MARETIQALRDQQKMIEDQGRRIQAQADTIRTQGRRIQDQDDSLASALSVAKDQQGQIQRLTAGLQAISRMAGVEHKVASAMGLHFEADVQNPAQPIPEPPAVPPSQDTVDAKTPEAMADVNAPGLVPGSTQDVAADATTTTYTPGEDIGGPGLKNLVDVTAPVAGTQAPLPVAQTRTETDVRIGDPMNPQAAFPLGGAFADARRVSQKQPSAEEIAAQAQLRSMSALRLARLRIRARVEQGEDLAIQDRIVRNASVTQDQIEAEIATLNAVVANQQGSQKREARHDRLVPQPSARPTPPPLAGTGHRTASAAEASDEELFLSF